MNYLYSFILSDQLDLWTQRASGCTCPDDVLDHTCACCVSNGCQCAGLKPQRCGQCGLEQYCDDSKYIIIEERRFRGRIWNLFLNSDCATPYLSQKFCQKHRKTAET